MIAGTNPALVLARRELRSALDTPAAYVLASAQSAFAAAWFYFMREFFSSGVAELKGYFAILPFVLAFTGTALGMRSWAEERRSGTLEMLVTLPASALSLAIGKYLGAFAVMLLSFIPLLGVPLAAGLLGSFDPGVIAGNFIALAFHSMAVLAVAQWASSWTNSHIQAFVLSLSILLFLMLVDRMAGYFIAVGIIPEIAAWLSMSRHFAAFSGGAIDTRDISYYLVLSAVFLVPTVRNIGMKR